MSKTIFPAVGALLSGTQTGCNGLDKHLGMMEIDSNVESPTRSSGNVLGASSATTIESNKAVIEQLKILRQNPKITPEALAEYEKAIHALEKVNLNLKKSNQVPTCPVPPPPPLPTSSSSNYVFSSSNSSFTNLPSKGNSNSGNTFDPNEIHGVKLKPTKTSSTNNSNNGNIFDPSQIHDVKLKPTKASSTNNNNNRNAFDPNQLKHKTHAFFKQKEEKQQESIYSSSIDNEGKTCQYKEGKAGSLSLKEEYRVATESDIYSDSGMGHSPSSSMSEVASVLDGQPSSTSKEGSPQGNITNVNVRERLKPAIISPKPVVGKKPKCPQFLTSTTNSNARSNGTASELEKIWATLNINRDA